MFTVRIYTKHHPKKYQQNLIRYNEHLFPLELLVYMIVINLLPFGSAIFIFFVFLLYTFSVSNLLVLCPWGWSLGWSKHVAVSFMYNTNFSIGLVVWICWYHFNIHKCTYRTIIVHINTRVVPLLYT